MSRRCSGILAFAAVFLAVASWFVPTAEAQSSSGKRTWELTAFNGLYIASDLYTTLGAQIGINNAYMYGGRLGFYPNPRVGVEFAYGRASSDLEIKNTSSLFPSSTPLGSLVVNQYDGNLIFQQRKMGNPKMTGFFSLGFGSTNFVADVQDSTGDPSKSHFSWNIGLGAKYDMSEKVALRLEGRYRTTNTDITTSSGVYCDFSGYCYSYATDWYSSGELSAGLTYKLGQ